MLNRTLSEQLNDLEAGEYSAEELTRAYLNRIEQSSLNAYITISSESAISTAREQDQRRAAGDAGPLSGIPIAHKDIFCTQGIRTTAASHILDNFVAPYSATVTEKLAAAGCVLLGKTNMDEFAMGSSNENSYFGPALNPWDTKRVTGGSSGGSAAAVAADLCSAATGTDTGGSIRQPSAFCGITGLKPTYGRISRWGIIAFASSLDQAGPMTHTAEDAAYLLSQMAGHDPKDSTSLTADVPDYPNLLSEPLTGLRIGLCEDFFESGLDIDSEQLVRNAVQELERLGAKVSPIRLPHVSYSVPAYYVIASAEASANLSRYDGVRYGHRCEDPRDLEDLYKRSRSEGFGDEVKRRVMVGAFTLSTGYYDAYYAKAQKVRRLIREDFQSAFKDVDILVGPTTPQPAFGLGEKTDDQVAMYLQDIYTIGVNLAGLPAMSVPAGQVQGLPVGLQLIGNYLDEARLLNTAHQFQLATDWHKHSPEA